MFSLYEERMLKHGACHRIDATVIQGVLVSTEQENSSSKQNS